MYTNKIYDYLIIGQGLAGTILSYIAHKNGHTVCVINQENRSSASYVAAGILAPITGPRLAKTWADDNAYTYAHTLYQELERELACRFYYPLAYQRVITDAPMLAYAERRLADPAYTPYIKRSAYNQHIYASLCMPAVAITQTAYIATTALLDTYRTWLQTKQVYRQEFFDESLLVINDDKIRYKDIQARNIIYCNGLAADRSKFFTHLAFNPTKGEILTIESNVNLTGLEAIATIFVLPIGNNRYHLGTTYERDYRHTLPTDVARDTLIRTYLNYYEKSYTLLNHQAGIRPTTLGHQPYSFWHPEHKHVGVCTGFGSKGLSLIPAHAHKLLLSNLNA